MQVHDRRSRALSLRRRLVRVAALGLSALGLTMSSGLTASADMPPAYRILVFTRTAGFAHPSIPVAAAALEELGAKSGFAVDVTSSPDAFTTDNLSQYAAVVFVSTTGNVLPAATNRAALEQFIRDGGGFVGVHAASDMGTAVRNGWPFYRDLVGAAFLGHTSTHVWAATDPEAGGIYEGPLADAPDDAESINFGGNLLRYRSWEPALVDVEDVNSPAMRGWGQWRIAVDEWYGFRTNPRPNVHVLASVDEDSYNPFAGDMGPGAADHPIAWCQNYQGGRSVYTAMGHTSAAWSNQHFLKHILGSIEMASGVAPFDCAAG